MVCVLAPANAVEGRDGVFECDEESGGECDGGQDEREGCMDSGVESLSLDAVLHVLVTPGDTLRDSLADMADTGEDWRVEDGVED